MANKFAALAVAVLALLLSGCPPTVPPAPVSITVTGVGAADPIGGLALFVSGSGFTHNGLVNIKMLNIPGRNSADYTNAPGLPPLSADANGNFFNFRVAAPCPDLNDNSIPNPGVNAALWVTDVATFSIAKHDFPPIFCGYLPPPRSPLPRHCPADIPQSQCR